MKGSVLENRKFVTVKTNRFCRLCGKEIAKGEKALRVLVAGRSRYECSDCHQKTRNENVFVYSPFLKAHFRVVDLPEGPAILIRKHLKGNRLGLNG